MSADAQISLKAGAQRGGSVAVVFLLVVLWYFSSLLAITTSKLTMQAAQVPLVLCCAQFLCATLVSGTTLLASQQGLAQVFPSGQAWKLMGGIALTYTLGFFFTNLAFSLAHASFVETVKSGEPLSTVLLAAALLGEREKPATYAALVPVTVGVALASSGGASGSLAALATTAASNFGFSGRAVYAKQLKRDCPKCLAATNDVCLFFNISLMGLFMLIPFAMVSEGAKLRVALADPQFETMRFAKVMALNSLMYTAYNQFSFMVLSRVSTASHAVLNVCRRVCVVGFTTIFFGTPLSLVNVIGMAIAVAGMAWFTQTKTSVSVPAKKQD